MMAGLSQLGPPGPEGQQPRTGSYQEEGDPNKCGIMGVTNCDGKKLQRWWFRPSKSKEPAVLRWLVEKDGELDGRTRSGVSETQTFSGWQVETVEWSKQSCDPTTSNAYHRHPD